MSNLHADLRNHAIQLNTKIEGFQDRQGIEIATYLLRRSIKLMELAAERIEKMGHNDAS